MIHLRKKIIATFVLLLSVQSNAMMNFLLPYDTLIRPPYDLGYCYNTTFIGEKGFSPLYFDSCGKINNPLQIWQCDQDALKMLEGFSPGSPIDQLRMELMANDDGIRGHIALCGDITDYYALAFTTRWFFHDDWFVELDVPLYHVALKNVCWTDLTQSQNAEDARVKALLTDNFAANVCALGGPAITGWERTSAGDIAALVNWFRDFPRRRELLTNVRVNFRAGLSVPAGSQADPDVLFAFPLSYTDGAVAIPFGGGLDLSLDCSLKAGFDVQLMHRFGNTKCRRIKTQIDQSDLILLQKASVYKDFGMIQRYNLYVEWDQPVCGFGLLGGYQYIKYGEDKYNLDTNNYSTGVADTAESLKDRTLHQIFINAKYDFSQRFADETRWRPYISVFSRIPFNGKRILMEHTIGVVLAFDF